MYVKKGTLFRVPFFVAGKYIIELLDLLSPFDQFSALAA
jgi:hypothetical protein